MKKFGLYIFSILYVALIIFLIILAKKYEPKYRVENLVIVNNKIVPVEVLLDFIKIKDKETLKELTAEMILDRIEKYPYVKDVEGMFIDTITYLVKIKEVEPFFIAVTNLGNFVVTRENKILPEDPRLKILDLPVLTVSNKLNANDVNSKNENFLVGFKSFTNIYKTDKALFEIISEMNIDNEKKLSLYLTKPKGKIIAGNEVDKSIALYLSEFWRQIILNSPDVNYDYIDLRFKDQIVVKHSNNSRTS